MKPSTPLAKPRLRSRGSSFVALFLIATLVAMPGCRWDPLGVQTSIDDVVGAVDRTRQTIEGESSAWRDELPKLVNSLNGMESTIAADAKSILAETTNQLQDLSSQTIQMSDAKAQELIAQAGVEFRCNAGFVKAGVVAQLRSIVEDLQFWKQNKRHQDKKPNHAVCWITPSALSLYQSGSNWLIDTANMADKNIVKVFGYSFWPSALPTLELQDSGGRKLRNVSVTAAYVTHYQINLDFSNERFPDAQPGARIVFRWPDQADPNTINLTLKAQSKLDLSNAVFSPTRPTAGKDPVTLQVTIKNTGGSRSGNFVVTWKPDPNDNAVRSVSQLPLEAGQSRTVSLGPYTYLHDGSLQSVVSLDNGDDTLRVSVSVLVQPTPTAIPPSNKWKIDVATGDRYLAGTDANVYITLFGDKANSDETRLSSSGRDPFERDQTDSFNIITAKNLGNLIRIRIRHNDGGVAPGWFLESIVITNVDTGKKWTFRANRWLAKDEGDHLIDIFLTPN